MNKKIEKIVLYDFEEPVIGGKGETRTITQACVMYEDKSFKNILVDNSDWDEETRKAYSDEYDTYMMNFLSEQDPEYKKLLKSLKEEEKEITKKKEQGIMDEDDLSDYYDLINEYDQVERKVLKKTHENGKLGFTSGEELENNFEEYFNFANNKNLPELPPKSFSKGAKDTYRELKKEKQVKKEDSLFQRAKNFFSSKLEKIRDFNAERDQKKKEKKKAKKEKEKTQEKGWVSKLWTVVLKHPRISLAVTTFGFLCIARNVERFSNNHSTKKGIVYEWSDLNSDEKRKTQEEQEVDYSNMYIDELLESTTHDKTQQAQNSIWNYLNYCNDTLAEKLLEKGKTSRFMIMYKEALSSYIAYNADSLYQDDINHIAGDSSLKSKTLNKAFDSGMKEEVLAYVASKEPIDKDTLFITEEGKEFHEKYAKLVANMASAKEKGEKEEAASSFRSALKKEMKQMKIEKEETDYIASYKSSITPIVAAAEIICARDHMDPILTDKEKKSFDDLLLREQVRENFKEYTRDLNDYQTRTHYANDILGTLASDKGPDLDDFILAAEADLTAREIYNEDDRDISDHSVFESRKEEKKESSSKEKQDNKETKKQEKVSKDVAVEEQQETSDIYEEENTQNEEQAKQEATRTAQEMQEKEDQNKNDLEEQIKSENNDQNVEENAEISGDNKDASGNISSSVEGLTTNGEDSDNGPLVDPDDYENIGNPASSGEENTNHEESSASGDSMDTEYVSPEDAPNIIEGEVPIEELSEKIISYLEQMPLESEKILTKRI